MLLSSFIFFLLGEILFLTKLSGFWFFVFLAFAFFAWRHFAPADFRKIRILAAPIIFLVLNLVLHNIYAFSFWAGQFHLLILTACFYYITSCYREPQRFPVFFRIFPIIPLALAGFIFFRSNVFENFVWKEIWLFLEVIFLLESDRQVQLSLNQAGLQKPSFLWGVIPAVVFLELAWFFLFLPITAISLTGAWLILFYLWLEASRLTWRERFSWREFAPQLFLALIMIVLVFLTGSWKMA